MSEMPVIDFEDLVDRVGGDVEFARELLGDFVTTLQKEVDELNTILVAGPPLAAATKAHALKGAAANLSAKQLAAATEEIERFCRRGDLEAGRSFFPAVATAALRFIEKASNL